MASHTACSPHYSVIKKRELFIGYKVILSKLVSVVVSREQTCLGAGAAAIATIEGWAGYTMVKPPLLTYLPYTTTTLEWCGSAAAVSFTIHTHVVSRLSKSDHYRISAF